MSTQVDMSRDVKVIFDLVSTASVSGNEHAAAEVFVKHATERGMRSSIDEVGNAIAETGCTTGDERLHLVLLGHIDTVPGDIPVRIKDGILHGRGSVDAKGPLASMLIAASIAQVPHDVRVSVVGAVGEEAAGSIGARHLAPKWSPDACIIGEPSGFNGVTLGYKGRLLCSATASCDNAHSAGSEGSASDMLLAWWNDALEISQSSNDAYERVFDQVQASVLNMSSHNDGLKQHATLRTGFRIPPRLDVCVLIEHLQALATDGIALEFDGAENAHLSDRNDAVARSLSSAIRTLGHRPRPKQKTGTADMNVVAPVWKCPIAAYGPGDSSLDHTPNEHLSLFEFESSIQVLKSAIETLIDEL